MRGIACIIFLTVALAAAQLDVAFMMAVTDEFYIHEILDYFEADERFDEVNFYNCCLGTPNFGEFLRHDVVFAGGGLYHDPDLFGDRLADYVDQGGCVVVEAGGLKYWFTTVGIGGRWRADGYCPYYSNHGNWLLGYEDLVIDEPGHEIFDGVSGVWDSYYRADTILRDGAVELAHYADAGGVAVSAAEDVVAANFTLYVGHEWTGDVYLIMANAACYLAAHSDVRETSWGRIKASF
jgi:hypothetical protein